ncbi:protein senC [Thioclava sp. SK-1]|uniref:SCO family protein n=1 Tax=Thioclava sp. SK-1 TaxID=1889770 RepID=UPI000826DEA7|nr:SCO family protein [Thioclava sp. SK-1]OCX61582.1 protein senC [Thioclava sp. SK-1]
MAIRTKTYAIGAGCLVVLGLGAMWAVPKFSDGSDDIFAQCRSSAVSGAGTLGGPFELVSETGATVTDTDVITQPSLLYFGYTFCPDVCPFDVARNGEATAILDSRGQTIQPVFISVDSARDTPEVVAEFTDIFHPRMLGLTGSPEQISAASKSYRTYFKVQNPGDPLTLIDHSTQSYLVFPELGYVEFFNRDLAPEAMADRIGCFVDAWDKNKT